MSSNQAAIRRRATINPPPSNKVPSSPQQQQTTTNTSSQSGGLTLPQVIQVIDSRLLKLESFMKDTKYNTPQLKELT